MRFFQSLSAQVATIFVIIFFISMPALAMDYYVSPAGKASWADATDPNTPCSVPVALSEAKAGDTVIFLDGTYTVPQGKWKDPAWEPANSGKSGSPITFKAQNDKQAILDGEAGSAEAAYMIGATSDDYIVWEGFKLIAHSADNSSDDKMASLIFYDSNYCEVKSCEFVGASHNTGGSINYQGIRFENSDHCTVRNCYLTGYIEADGNHNTSAFKSYGTDGTLIERCTFENNTVGIYDKQAGKNNTYRYNFFKNTADANMLFQTNGVRTGYSLPYGGHAIHDNVFIGGGSGIENGSGDSEEWDDIQIFNNTFIDVSDGGYNSSAAIIHSNGDNHDIYNNIFYSCERAIRGKYEKGAPTQADHNCFYDWSTYLWRVRDYSTDKAEYDTLAAWQSSGELYGGGNPGTGSIADDPQFENASGTLSKLADFYLTQNSPCNYTGRNGDRIGADISQVGAAVTSQVEVDAPLMPPFNIQIGSVE